jgi:hypothetical protein
MIQHLFQDWTSPTATAFAALVAAFVSIISLFLNFRLQKHLARRASAINEDKGTRDALRSLIKLTARVKISVARLVDLAPQKNGDELVIDSMQTLVIISDFFNETADEKVLGLPAEVLNLVNALRKALTKFFVFIDFEETQDPAHYTNLQEQKDVISKLISDLTDDIKPYVAVSLDKL